MLERLKQRFLREPNLMRVLELPASKLSTGKDIEAAMRAANLRYPWINQDIGQFLSGYQCYHDPHATPPYHTFVELEHFTAGSLATRFCYGATPTEIEILKPIFENPFSFDAHNTLQIEADTRFPLSTIHQSWGLQIRIAPVAVNLSLTTTKPSEDPDHFIIQTHLLTHPRKLPPQAVGYSIRAIEKVLAQLQARNLLPPIPPLSPIPPYQEAG